MYTSNFQFFVVHDAAFLMLAQRIVTGVTGAKIFQRFWTLSCGNGGMKPCLFRPMKVIKS